MPTKRRIVIFLIVLSVMLFAKYMWGQDGDAVGWDPQHVCFGNTSVEDYILGFMVWGPTLGAIVGMVKVFNRNLAARAGMLFNSEMVRLRL